MRRKARILSSRDLVDKEEWSSLDADDDFVKCYNTKTRNDRKPSERFKGFTYEDLTKRGKVSSNEV